MEMEMDSVIKFVPLIGFEEDYEIMNEYPFMIRNRKTGNILKEFKRINNIDNDYICVCLNTKIYPKHVLIAKQYILNDDPINNTIIDHINRDKTDYHLDNLRWTNQSENCKNRTSHKGVVYEFVDDIPDDSIIVEKYGEHTFFGYYYFDNAFYYYNGVQYRKLYPSKNRSGSLYVCMRDINNRRVNLFYDKFKAIYDLI
mgnify:CR=1 FL=1